MEFAPEPSRMSENAAGLITPTCNLVGVFRFMTVPTDVRLAMPSGMKSPREETVCESSRKSSLTRKLENLAQVLSASFPEFVPRAISIGTRLQTDKFNLVVVGQFKRGKSTLVNALVGDDILPTAVVPLTSIVTILHYGSEEKITVSFAGGTSENISRKDLPGFVTERFNPQNVKQVESVEIELPCGFLGSGIRLVDTPGVGSVYVHNTDAAIRFLPESDATIFLMTADQPLSAGEVEFLRNVREHVTKIFFVLNKVDMLSEAEQHEAEEFIRGSLSNEMSVPKMSIRLFLLSSKTALRARLQNNDSLEAESNIQPFGNALTEFLKGEKADILVSSAARRARRIAAEASTLAKLRLKAYSESADSLQMKVDEFKKFRGEIQRRREDISRVIYAAYNIVAMIEEDRVLFEKSSLPELESRFDEIVTRFHGLGASQLIEQLNRAIITLVTAAVDRWRTEEEERVKEEFNSAARDLFGRMNELIDDIYQHVAGLFNVEFRRLEDYPLFNDESEFYYFILEDIKPSLEELTDAIVKRLPKRIARRLILRKEKETLRIEFDRQCGRVRYDVVQRIDKSMSKLGDTFSESVNGHLARIEEIIREAMLVREKGSLEISSQVSEYETVLRSMLRLENELAEFE